MNRLGIIGGIGPESTVVYYRLLIEKGRERLGVPPPIVLNSIDVDAVLRLAAEDPVPGLRDYLLSELAVLSRAGASLALIAANTPHIVFDEVSERSPIPLVSIVEAARDKTRELGFRRVGLLGTRFTMQGVFYPKVFSAAGIELVAPRDDEQAFVHGKYVDELLRNVFRRETRETLLELIGIMRERDGVQGVLLAGTELPLLLSEESASGLPLLDTTKIHVAAAARRLWS